MGCKKLKITDYYRLTPTTGNLNTPIPGSTSTQKKSPRGFKPVVSVSTPNYRYYSPSLGRWLSRDPIEENGGLNLYAFISNRSVNIWDYLGLAKIQITKKWSIEITEDGGSGSFDVPMPNWAFHLKGIGVLFEVSGEGSLTANVTKQPDIPKSDCKYEKEEYEKESTGYWDVGLSTGIKYTTNDTYSTSYASLSVDTIWEFGPVSSFDVTIKGNSKKLFWVEEYKCCYEAEIEASGNANAEAHLAKGAFIGFVIGSGWATAGVTKARLGPEFYAWLRLLYGN